MRRASKAYAGAGLKTKMTSVALGGFGVGFIERNWGDKIPSLPVVGRKGALALGIYFLNPKNAILRDVGVAAAAISGYELGSTGAVTGDYSNPYLDGDEDGWIDDDDDDDDDFVDGDDDDDFLTT